MTPETHFIVFCIVAVILNLSNAAGYHRLLCHKSFKTQPIVRNVLTLLSALHSGSPVLWVGLHRIHHTFSDQPGDPHSTKSGFFYAHSGWLFDTKNPLLCILLAVSGFGLQIRYLVTDLRRLAGKQEAFWRKTSRDLIRERFMIFLDTPLVISGLFAIQVAAAWWIGEWWGIAWLWAMHVVLNNTSWVINSICHWPSFGTAAEDSRDLSRDVPWLGWLTNGDSYHNSHHQFQGSAKHALYGGMDLSWLFICLLSRLGLATDVKLPKGSEAPAWMTRQQLIIRIPGTIN